MPNRTASPLVLLALALIARASAGQTPRYTLTDIGGAFQGDFFDLALSDSGVMTAWAFDTANQVNVAVRWKPGSLRAPAAADVVELPPGLTAPESAGIDVNSAGVVVGWFGESGTSFPLARGFRSENGTAVELFTPLGLRALPNAINNAGWIVGEAGARPGGTPGAVLWAPDLTPSFVLDLDAAYDINERGEIACARIDASGVSSGFLYDAGNLIPLGNLSARGSVVPNAIDDQGRIVGTCRIGTRDHAFLWTPSAGMTELRGTVSGTLDSFALDIANDGTIVGWAQGHPLLWNVNGSALDLDTLITAFGPASRWSRSFPLAVNSSGQIAGTAWDGASFRPVLLTPTALAASALVPGVAGNANSMSVTGGTPGRTTFLFGDLEDALDGGYTRIPGCGALGLELGSPHFVAASPTDGAGRASFLWNVPASLAGVALRLQALQLWPCAVSDVVHVAF